MARGFEPRGHLGFCHYECSEVIQKQLLLAMRLLLSLCSISSDKNRAISVELVSRLPRRVFYTARNDKRCAASSFASDNEKNKIPRKTIFSKIKVRIKLSCNSVGQGRGGLEGTVRPSQLRAGSPPKKNFNKINKHLIITNRWPRRLKRLLAMTSCFSATLACRILQKLIALGHVRLQTSLHLPRHSLVEFFKVSFLREI